MKIKFGKTSKINLCDNLDYRLVHIICEVAKLDLPYDFTVFQTKRTLEEQKENVKNGTSKTMNSKHLPDSKGIVRAVDIVPYVNGNNSWDMKYFHALMPIFKAVAFSLYPDEIEFGYDWKDHWDSAHIEIKDKKEI
jgi:peptidoglycan L-alanyl-D-glutamate endopeptidase CwlK